jgi:hypothetical protein
MASQSTSEPRFYRLRDPLSARAFRANLEGIDDDLGLIRGCTPPRGPIRASWAAGGGSPGEVVWTTLALPLVVSRDIVNMLRSESLTGWLANPIELTDKAGKAHAGYSLLTFKGRCGALDESRAVKLEKLYPGGVFPVWRGLYFDVDTWDGSDLFMPEGEVGWILASEKARRVLRRAKNLDFQPIEDVEQDLST